MAAAIKPPVSFHFSFKFWSCVVVGILSIFLSCFYCYMSSLYLVDEIYDVEGPSSAEFSMDQKLTLRVIAPDDKAHVKTFVEKYSLCPVVHVW